MGSIHHIRTSIQRAVEKQYEGSREYFCWEVIVIEEYSLPSTTVNPDGKSDRSDVDVESTVDKGDEHWAK